MSERILYAAIMHNDEPVFLPRPKRHHHIIALLGLTNPWPIRGPQGFITSEGRFVNRKLGAQIAWQSRQIPAPLKMIFSEDLW